MGIIGNSFTNIEYLTQIIRQMGTWQIHRGPDQWGEWIKPGIGLGHNRLAVVDIHGGKQPMISEDKKIAIVFNGEVYNFLKIRNELQKKGHRFLTNHSDTEVIIHGYREWGVEIFNILRGMFAIAIWDEDKKHLILARDHIGIKPLYYSILPNEQGIIFASEPKTIIGSELIQPIFNEKTLVNYFMFRAPLSPDTFFKNISKVTMGTYLIFDYYMGIIQIEKYWEPKHNKVAKEPIEVNIQHLETLLSSVVKSHLMADVPIGIFLSGGVDSSLLAYHVKENYNAESFSIGSFGKYDESLYAKKVASKFNLNLSIKMITGTEFIKKFEDWMFFNDDPVSDPSALALMLMSELAKSKGMKVMISGEGGDELFAGYLSYLQYIFFRYISLIPLSSIIGKLIAPLFYRHTRDYLENLKQPLFFGTSHISSINDLRNLIQNKHHDQIEILINSAKKNHCKFSHMLRQVLIFDQFFRLPDDILARTDRATMAFSLEARVPLLDRDIIEFANNIPDQLCIKMIKGETKWILKKILSQYLPNKLIYRKKRGFEIPIEEWIITDFEGIIKKFLIEKKIPGLEYEFLEKINKLHRSGNYNYTGIIWSWIVLEKWYRQWILREYKHNHIKLSVLSS